MSRVLGPLGFAGITWLVITSVSGFALANPSALSASDAPATVMSVDATSSAQPRFSIVDDGAVFITPSLTIAPPPPAR